MSRALASLGVSHMCFPRQHTSALLLKQIQAHGRWVIGYDTLSFQMRAIDWQQAFVGQGGRAVDLIDNAQEL